MNMINYSAPDAYYVPLEELCVLCSSADGSTEDIDIFGPEL